MDLREVFATNLRRWRYARGLSQDDLAYEAGVSRSYLSQLEKGAYYASLKIVGRLTEALNVEPAELLRMTARERKRAEEAGRRNKIAAPSAWYTDEITAERTPSPANDMCEDPAPHSRRLSRSRPRRRGRCQQRILGMLNRQIKNSGLYELHRKRAE
jgi:transcriptional regulator with XRE-family HTH domain